MHGEENPCNIKEARGWIRAAAATLCHSHSHSHTGSKLCLQPAPQLMATRSLIHWAKPGIKPLSSWVVVRFITDYNRSPLITFLYCLITGFCSPSAISYSAITSSLVMLSATLYTSSLYSASLGKGYCIDFHNFYHLTNNPPRNAFIVSGHPQFVLFQILSFLSAISSE